MVFKGYIYWGLKLVYWSLSLCIVLVEVELEYFDGYISFSVYVVFLVVEFLVVLWDVFKVEGLDLFMEMDVFGKVLQVVIWIIIFWMLLVNLVVLVNERFDYVLVDDGVGRFLLVVVDLIEMLSGILVCLLSWCVIVKGVLFVGLIYCYLLLDCFSLVVIGGDYIIIELGIGFVYIVFGYGVDDFYIGQKNGLLVFCFVDEVGNFMEEVGLFVGLNVFKDVNFKIIEVLEFVGVLFKQEVYGYCYFYDWCIKKFIIFWVMEQWFVFVEGFC